MGSIPEFIYMPGYVYLAAGVYAFGGGLLAIKMIGVASGALATAAVYGTARAIFGRGAAFLAGLLCALWPAGIAVSSVTGTDMPAAALLGLAVWLLARNAGRRPLGAPAAFGLVMGLGAYVRAVALPLVLLAAFHFRARGASWAHVVTRTIAAAVVAFLVLLPWGLRNHHVYGELFFTDSHGGHTALVGANPNSDGSYSRSLNRLFSAGTGYALFAPPHRESDRVAYALAKQWTAFSPRYALGLLVAKADRLLGAERPLLYWPLYRQSVLPPGTWFDVHRAGIERVVDGSYYLMIAAMVLGIVAAAGRRNWPALTLVPLPAALLVLYTLFFAEARYHLAIVVLLLPFAGNGLAWVGDRRCAISFADETARRGARAGGDRGADRRGHPGAAVHRVAPGRQRRDRAARKEPLGGLRLPGCRRQAPLRRARDRPAARGNPVAGAGCLGRVRPAALRGAGGCGLRPRRGSRALPHLDARGGCRARRSTPPSTSWPTGAIWHRPPGRTEATPITLAGAVVTRRRKAARGGGNFARGACFGCLCGTLRGSRSSSSDGAGTLWISAIEVEPDRP